jgi:tellurite methyltransferase
MSTNASISFFDRQFEQQARAHAFELNPFEVLALEFARGDVLDFACGLGNFAVAAARRGCRVIALDASPHAIESLRERAADAGLPIDALLADAVDWQPRQKFDTIVCIGLLMFLDCDTAEALLRRQQAAVRPGGLLIVNVLVQGTTFMDMFDPNAYCLFEPERLTALFAGWEIVRCEDSRFPAPHETVKVFRTVVARRPVEAAAG